MRDPSVFEDRVLEKKRQRALFVKHRKKSWEHLFHVVIEKEAIDPQCRVCSNEIESVK